MACFEAIARGFWPKLVSRHSTGSCIAWTVVLERTAGDMIPPWKEEPWGGPHALSR